MWETLGSLSVVELCEILLGHRANQTNLTISLGKTTQCGLPVFNWRQSTVIASAGSLRFLPLAGNGGRDGGGVAYENITSLGEARCLSLCMFCCFWDQIPNRNNLKSSFAHCFGPPCQERALQNRAVLLRPVRKQSRGATGSIRARYSLCIPPIPVYTSSNQPPLPILLPSPNGSFSS